MPRPIHQPGRLSRSGNDRRSSQRPLESTQRRPTAGRETPQVGHRARAPTTSNDAPVFCPGFQEDWGQYSEFLADELGVVQEPRDRFERLAPLAPLMVADLEAEQALGPRFDLRASHDIILRDGAVPLALARVRMERWVRDQRGNSGR